MIKLYLYKQRPSTQLISTHIGKLPSLLQTKIRRKKQERKQELSIAGYLLLQNALENDFSTSLEDLTFLESGKPVLKNQAIFFNISHAAERIGLVISNEGAVGLDIENFRFFEDVRSSFAFFSKVEQEEILSAHNPNQKMIEFWSKKEAFIKAIGGQMFDLAQLTDVRFKFISWKDKIYNFYQIEEEFDGFIWVATSFSTNNIVLNYVDEL